MTNILLATFVIGCAASLCKIAVDKYKSSNQKTAIPVSTGMPLIPWTPRLGEESPFDRFEKDTQPRCSEVSYKSNYPYVSTIKTIAPGESMVIRVLPGKSDPGIFYAPIRRHVIPNPYQNSNKIQCWKKMDKANWVGECPVCDYAKAWRNELGRGRKLSYEKCETEYLYNVVQRNLDGVYSQPFLLSLSMQDHQHIMASRWQQQGGNCCFIDLNAGCQLMLVRDADDNQIKISFGGKSPAHHCPETINSWMESIVDPIELTNNQVRVLSRDQIIDCVIKHHIHNKGSL